MERKFFPATNGVEFGIACRAVMVHRICDKCEKGVMGPTGQTIQTGPQSMRMLHKCSECGHSESYDVQYPKLEFVPHVQGAAALDMMRRHRKNKNSQQK